MLFFEIGDALIVSDPSEGLVYSVLIPAKIFLKCLSRETTGSQSKRKTNISETRDCMGA